MGMLGRLLGSLKTSVTDRWWTPQEVREFIAKKELDQALHATQHLNPRSANLDAERNCLLGEIAFHRRDDAEAERHFRAALKAQPGLNEAHYGLSLLLGERGQFDDAVRHAQFAVGEFRRNGRYLAQLGYCHLCLGNNQVAETPLRRATLDMPGNASLWNNLGIALRMKGNRDEALQCFRRAVKLDTGFEAARAHLAQTEAELASAEPGRKVAPDAVHASRALIGDIDEPGLQAVLQLELAGEFQAAIDRCESLLLQRPDDDRVPTLLARLYETVGDVESASDALSAYLATHPQAVQAAGALGLVALRANDCTNAEKLLRRALDAFPDHFDYALGVARALKGQGRFVDAEPFFLRAVELAPGDITIQAQYISNLANQCRYGEAMVLIDELAARGVAIDCEGAVLTQVGRLDEALAALDRDLERRPEDPGLRFQRAEVQLLMERFETGWDDYRYRGLATGRNFRMLPFPVWRGEPLEGKKIIVLAEQGLGDQVMFASCLEDLLAMRPRKVVLEVHRRVAKTFARTFTDCEVVASSQADLNWATEHPDTDLFIPLADLPGIFRRGRDRFPAHDGYLRADPERVAHWRRLLEASGPGPYIGVSWRGGTELTRTSLRTLEPAMLYPLADAAKATWVCLQYGNVQSEVDAMADSRMPLNYWPESISDLDEFAAMISALDLVITVCNTTVHYAGALGKPVWILSPKVPEWRYGLSSRTLAWYPSSRMYRQQSPGAWTELVDAVGQDLSARVPGM